MVDLIRIFTSLKEFSARIKGGSPPPGVYWDISLEAVDGTVEDIQKAAEKRAKQTP